MKVHIVFHKLVDDNDVVGVYTTQEKAEETAVGKNKEVEASKKECDGLRWYEEYIVEEWDVIE